MKNIHLIPTDKPSRLYKDDNQVLTLNTHPVLKGIFTNGIGSNQHIYITSEEKPKEGDWFLSKEGIVHNNFGWNFGDKKIVLTTDPDLIKDGVQAIDDEFLEWFVKNPSCERVETQIVEYGFDEVPICKYEIIIPKEEPKQETLEEVAKELHPVSPQKRKIWLQGAKWQQEQDNNKYSEEEVISIQQEWKTFNDAQDSFNGQDDLTFIQWFEQFKKK
jgi:hypothetical protein